MVFVACSAVSAKKKDTNKEPVVFDLTNKLIQEIHYNQQSLNDEFSKNVFDAFLESADPNKRFLLSKDIELLSKMKFQLDDAIKGKDLTFFNQYVGIIEKRESMCKKIIEAILIEPIPIDSKDSIELDSDKYNYVDSKKELSERWTAYIQSRVINELYFAIKNQEENDTLPQKSIQELEKESREKVGG